MKVAIVGIGHIAGHQIAAIGKLDGLVELVGAYDCDAGPARKRVAPCRFHKSLDDLIKRSPADLVVVATPNADHVITASKLLAAGRAVMVEKPLCETLADVKKLAKQARARDIFFHTAFHAAFGREILWWRENRSALTRRLGPVDRFQMGFYDPYIARDGAVRPSARGLGGSWYDSGINALSVLDRIADPGSMRVRAGQMFHARNIACGQIKGSARLECRVDGTVCAGEIDTNWTLGLNRKVTMLGYRRGAVILDHSAQKVIIRDAANKPEIISLQNGLARLTNHYVGVFQDLEQAFAHHKDNLASAVRLHGLLFAAADNKGKSDHAG